MVTEIRTGRHGLPKDREPSGLDCCDQIILTSESKGDVLAKCGQPYYRTSRNEELREQLGGTQSREVMVAVEEWTYNCGPQRFLRIITFRNGQVIDIRTGNYGR